MKLRLPGRRRDDDDDESTPAAAPDLAAQQLTTVGKGRPTPRRSEAQGRRPGPPPPPPTTRKEAYRRQREQNAANRGSAREAAARGDESALPARDRGPEKRLVRDLVDARRNAGSLFLIVAALVLVGYFIPNAAVQSYTVYLWFAFFLLIIGDSVVLGRRIKKKLTERFPTVTKTKGLIWYGISRATMIRRWRFPKPQVQLGAEV